MELVSTGANGFRIDGEGRDSNISCLLDAYRASTLPYYITDFTFAGVTYPYDYCNSSNRVPVGNYSLYGEAVNQLATVEVGTGIFPREKFRFTLDCSYIEGDITSVDIYAAKYGTSGNYGAKLLYNDTEIDSMFLQGGVGNFTWLKFEFDTPVDCTSGTFQFEIFTTNTTYRVSLNSFYGYTGDLIVSAEGALQTTDSYSPLADRAFDMRINGTEAAAPPPPAETGVTPQSLIWFE
jgi:hypothetical protein